MNDNYKNDIVVSRRNNIFWIQILLSVVWFLSFSIGFESFKKYVDSLFENILFIYLILFVIPAIINTCFCYLLNRRKCLYVLIYGIILLPFVLWIILGMSIHPHTSNPYSGAMILYFSGYLIYMYHVLVLEKCEVTKDARLSKLMKVLKVTREYIPICFLLIGFVLFIILLIINGVSLGLF